MLVLPPTYDDACVVRVATESSVGPQQTDGNAHMNVRHIYALGVAGADVLSELAGVDDRYRATRSMGTFGAEHHITYLAEIHAGDVVAPRPLWVGRSSRAAHMLVLITNESTRMLAAVLELVIVHVDLGTRRPAPFPADVAASIDAGVAGTASLGFDLPLCGFMQVRGGPRAAVGAGGVSELG
ncbi:thioesterase family protein [Aeromicrobium sp. WCS2018Hpa-31]|uniref:thioesterase family protein n=1 Tax=Aeromicrobium sp. WCS2018Hpa-31 TaxID=3073628 RepID=UPI0028830EDF|nr:thioesterase family protein [Aeromicrobium sp. WCS2018Hpa-31]